MTDRLAALLPYPKTVRALPWPAGAGHEPGQAAGDITVDVDKRLPAEGYQLRISPAKVRVTAGGAAGAFYAAQTMRLLLPDEAWRAAPRRCRGRRGTCRAWRSTTLPRQFQLWTESIRDSRALEYVTFPRACALAEVAWSGHPAQATPAAATPAAATHATATPARATSAPDWHGRSSFR